MLSGCGSTPVADRSRVVPRPAVVPAAIGVGSHVFVAVSVATLWGTPTSARTVDAPALAAPVRVGAGLATISRSPRRALTGRIETQALYGDPLTVIGPSGTWLH